jgi:hypothetical protein
MAQNRQTTDKSPDNDEVKPIYHKHWFWPALIIIGAVLFVAFMASLLAVGMSARHFEREHGLYHQRYPLMMHKQGGNQSGNFTNNQSRIEGVVTQVNGSTFTIAGHGVTNDVDTNTSTQYSGGSQVRVNDTIVALGTVSGGRFTATHVILNP